MLLIQAVSARVTHLGTSSSVALYTVAHTCDVRNALRGGVLGTHMHSMPSSKTCAPVRVLHRH